MADVSVSPFCLFMLDERRRKYQGGFKNKYETEEVDPKTRYKLS